jgi:hypothetical protein
MPSRLLPTVIRAPSRVIVVKNVTSLWVDWKMVYNSVTTANEASSETDGTGSEIVDQELVNA